MIETIAFINGKCIYSNKDFWLNESMLTDIENNYDNYVVLDYRKNPVSKDKFIEEKYIMPQHFSINYSLDAALSSNIYIGKNIIICFRKEYMEIKDKSVSSLELGIKTGNVINLLLAGCFKEAIQVLEVMERDAYLTDERINRYIEIIKSADAINYDDEDA